MEKDISKQILNHHQNFRPCTDHQIKERMSKKEIKKGSAFAKRKNSILASKRMKSRVHSLTTEVNYYTELEAIKLAERNETCWRPKQCIAKYLCIL